MKYKDLITIFVPILFIASLGIAIGDVTESVWFLLVPIGLLVTLALIYVKLWR